MIICHSREIEKDIIVIIIMLPSHEIYMDNNWRPRDHTLGLDLDLVRQPSKALVVFVPPVSIEDHPLLWMAVRSQTYYSEHIVAYGSGKARYALVVGSGSF